MSLPLKPGTALFGPRLRGSDVARTFGIVLVLMLAGDVAIRALVTLPPADTGDRVNFMLASFAVSSLSILAALWYVYPRRRGISFADLGYVAPDPVWAMRAVAAGFFLVPLGFALFILLRQTVRPEVSASATALPDLTVIHALALLLYGGFIAPIAEELLFRGVLFGWLRQRFSFWPAAALSALAFGLVHLRFEAIVVTGLIGIVLAYFYERTRSLATAILVHQTYNSLNLLMTFSFIWFSPAPGS